MKRVIVALLVIAAGSMPALAKYSGGSGDPNDPYQIANVADLITLANDTNDYNKCFVMTADIDLDPCLPGNPAFTTAVIAPQGWGAFTGVFDGKGHKIVNLTIDTAGAGNDYLGLIGRTGAGTEIKNLGIENSSITGGENSVCIGALVGKNTQGNITNCYATVNITAGKYADYIGGLAGYNYSGNIISCYAQSSIQALAQSDEIGGLAGYNNDSGLISNCYAKGTLSAGTNSNHMGGLVGINYGDVELSYAACSLHGFFYQGGLIGFNGISYPEEGDPILGLLINCIWDIQVSGTSNAVGSGGNYGEVINTHGKTTSEMYVRSTYTDIVGWDFVGETANGCEDYWRLCNEGLEYPKLVWQYLPADIVCPDGVDIEDLDELCDQWLLAKLPADVAPPGGDGIVNFADFAVFADQWPDTQDIYALLNFAERWLKVGLPNHSADISPSPDGDGIVNFADLAILCENWLSGL